jgi:hypothetical protein
MNLEQFRGKQTKVGPQTKLDGLRKTKLDMTGILAEIVTVIFSFLIRNYGLKKCG